jgi:hypothetical protein|tara:strand:- start:20376 stop:20951 length:576 start_codon:yes stop_codon:yes gene_type:complete
MQTFNENKFIAYDTLDLRPRVSKHLIHCIKKYGEHNQYKTSIRLGYAVCKVFQPWKHNRDDFDLIRHLISNKASQMVNKSLFARKDIWGLHYTGDLNYCHYHNHGKFNGYAGVLYLEADEDCGQLHFPEYDIYVEPEPNRIILFDPRIKHGVMPNLDQSSNRVAIAFNVDVISDALLGKNNISKDNLKTDK